MVPVRDDNPTYTVPWVTYALILANSAVFFYELSLGRQLDDFFRHYSVIPAQIAPALGAVLAGQLTELPRLTPLVTAMFLHAGFLHVAGNMLYLWIFGDNVEDRMGHLGFLVFYLLCGIGASLIQLFFNAASQLPNLGASGAIAGVLGAYVIQFPRAQVRAVFPLGFFFIPFNISAFWFLGWWFVQQSLYGVAGLGTRTAVGVEQGGVAYWAHAGGFALGAVLVFLFVRNPRQRYF
ncbi:rhomboid family intramembrane serine protease [Anthocerotibacter panamensis]|uniref:rhomboid family intramembrane serine protease n=1 Tax=Anthocerotibacter panamensis TaxID=2857077 RepID=UPI001C406369|nr:rhomboid family intramembrane serine protease [Anthocerotibacter panamensis]